MEDNLSLDELIEISKKVDNWVYSEDGTDVALYKGSLKGLDVKISQEFYRKDGVDYNYIIEVTSLGVLLGNHHSIGLGDKEQKIKKLYHSIEYKMREKTLKNARDILDSDKPIE